MISRRSLLCAAAAAPITADLPAEAPAVADVPRFTGIDYASGPDVTVIWTVQWGSDHVTFTRFP